MIFYLFSANTIKPSNEVLHASYGADNLAKLMEEIFVCIQPTKPYTMPLSDNGIPETDNW